MKINNNSKENIKIENNNNKNKSLIDYNNGKENSVDTFESELNLSCGSMNSISPNSNFDFSNSFIKRNKTNYKENSNIQKINVQKKMINAKSLDNNFSFKFDNKKNKITKISPNKKKVKKNKSNETYTNQYINQVIKGEKNSDNINNDNNSNGSIKYYTKKTKKILNDYNNTKIITLDNINHNFSEKIKKKINKRKIIEKLKELLKLIGLKINENILDLYLKQDSLDKTNIYEKDIFNNLDYSISSFTNKILSKIFESTYHEDIDLSLTKTNNTFNKFSLIKIKTESFEIKSSYKNINSLTNGEVIKNKKFKILIEKLIKKNINKNISNHKNNKTFFSMISLNSKNKYLKQTSLTNNKNAKNKEKDNVFYSEGINNSFLNKNCNNLIISYDLENMNKKLNTQNIEKNNDNVCISHEDEIIGQYNNTSSKFFEKELIIKNNTLKKMDLHNQQNKDIINKNDSFIPSRNNNNVVLGKQLYLSKKANTSNQKLMSINNFIFFKDLFENKKNNNHSKSENLLLFQNNNTFTNIIKINNKEDKKTNICIIY